MWKVWTSLLIFLIIVWQGPSSLPPIHEPVAELFGPHHRRTIATADRGHTSIHTPMRTTYSRFVKSIYCRSPWHLSYTAVVCCFHVCMAARIPRRRFGSSWRRRRRQTRWTPRSRRVLPPLRYLPTPPRRESLNTFVALAGVTAGGVPSTAESLQRGLHDDFYNSLCVTASCDIHPVVFRWNELDRFGFKSRRASPGCKSGQTRRGRRQRNEVSGTRPFSMHTPFRIAPYPCIHLNSSKVDGAKQQASSALKWW